MRWLIDDQDGQAAVEAAFLLPLFLLVVGLLVQPALLLYNRCVMYSAAAQGCRLLETQVVDEATARAYVLRRLSAIPQVDVFHCGKDAGWDIELSGSEGENVQVSITNKAKALPLLGISAHLAASVGDDGSIAQRVTVAGRLWPAWALEGGVSAQDLANEWE